MSGKAGWRLFAFGKSRLVYGATESLAIRSLGCRYEYLHNELNVKGSDMLCLVRNYRSLEKVPTTIPAKTYSTFFTELAEGTSQHWSLPQPEMLSHSDMRSFVRRHLHDFPLDIYRPQGVPDMYLSSLLRLFDEMHKSCISPESLTNFVQLNKKVWPRLFYSQQLELSHSYNFFQSLCEEHNIATIWGGLHSALEEPLTKNKLVHNPTAGKYVMACGLENLSVLELRLLKHVCVPDGQNISELRGVAQTSTGTDEDQKVKGVPLSECIRDRGCDFVGFVDYSQPTRYFGEAVNTVMPDHEREVFGSEFLNDYSKTRPSALNKARQHVHYRCKTAAQELNLVHNLVNRDIEASKATVGKGARNGKVAVIARRIADAKQIHRILNSRGVPVYAHGPVRKSLAEDGFVRVLLAYIEVVVFYASVDTERHTIDQVLFLLVGSYPDIPFETVVQLFSRARQTRSSVSDLLDHTDVEFKSAYADINRGVALYKGMNRTSKTSAEKVQIIVIDYLKSRGWERRFEETSTLSDEVHGENIGMLVELLNGWCGNVRKLRKLCNSTYARELDISGDAPTVHVLLVKDVPEFLDSSHPSQDNSGAYRDDGHIFDSLHVFGMAQRRMPSTMNQRIWTRGPPGMLPEEQITPTSFDISVAKSKNARLASFWHNAQEWKRFEHATRDTALSVTSSSAERYNNEMRVVKPSRWLLDDALGEVMWLDPDSVCDRGNLGTTRSAQGTAVMSPNQQMESFLESVAPFTSESEVSAAFKSQTERLRHVSFSQIYQYQRCPKAYLFKYIACVAPGLPSAIMLYGKLMHEIVEIFWERREEDGSASIPEILDGLTDLFDKEWSQCSEVGSFFSRNHHETLRQAGVSGIEAFVNRYAAQPVPLAIEAEFNIPLRSNKNICLKGFIDMIDSEGNVIEFKSNKVGDRGAAAVDALARTSLQPQLYGIACPGANIFVEGVENGHRALVKTTPEDTEKVFDTLDQVVDKIHSMEFSATPSSFACNFCDFKDVCTDSVV